MSLVVISGTAGPRTGLNVARTLVIYRRSKYVIEQVCNIMKIIKAIFLTISEGSYKYRKETAKINPVILDCKWRYW